MNKWKELNKIISFIVCGYMNGLKGAENGMVEIVSKYNRLFPEDEIFHVLHPNDDTQFQMKLFYNEDPEKWYKEVRSRFACLKDRNLTYFVTKINKRNGVTNYDWTWNRSSDVIFNMFVQDWASILEEKYRSGYEKEITALIKDYALWKKDIIHNLNQAIRDVRRLHCSL
jgi:hypothetical protein